MNLLSIAIFFILLPSCSLNIKPTSAQIDARMSIHHEDNETIFYFIKPAKNRFPIVVICQGSTTPDDIQSIWPLTEFAQFASLKDSGILVVEKDGVDAGKVDKDRFFANYTRSKRFHDHVAVIDHLIEKPPEGFDGRLVFIGSSEGGALANRLSIHYPQTMATINWSGASDHSWPDELWTWIEQARNEHPFLTWFYTWWHKAPKTREEFDKVMAETLKDPSHKRWFLGMTYRYHADAINTLALDYKKIHAPMLIVCGTKDSLISSCDSFVSNAQHVKAPITYWRVEDMEHRISQNKQDIIPKSFEWLRGLSTIN